MQLRRPAVIAAYAGSILAANLATDHLGMVPVWPHLTVTAGTYAAGGALLLRDVVQDLYGWRWVLLGILVGAVLTAATAPGLALASAVAFTCAELLDMGVYTPLRARGWAVAALASGCAGALVDTLLFLWIAPFPITAHAVTGQLVGKALWATALPILLLLILRQVRRVVPRHSLGT